MIVGLGPLPSSLRIAWRALPWLLLALLCAAPRAPAAGATDGRVSSPGFAAARLPPAAAAGAEDAPPARYRWDLIVAGLVVVAEALVIGALLIERVGRRRAELSLAERLSFESLLSEVSARLIPVSLRDVDIEIEGGLRRVAEFLHMDRAGLHEYGADGAVVPISWSVTGVDRRPPVMEAGRFPWAAKRLRGGHDVQFSRLAELPEEAAIDRQSHADAGTRSLLALPLSAGGSLLGVLSFDSVRGERTWPDEVVKRLRLLSEIFAGALERKRLELALAERLRFETLLSEQSATFSSLSATEVDTEIKRALRRIADFFNADWGSLAEFSHDHRVARITHAWVAEGTPPRPGTISLADVPWVMGRLQSGEVVRFSRIDELPEDQASVDRRTYLKLGIKSQVEVPLKVGGALLGTLTFSSLGAERVWADELVQRLQLLGEVFANVLSRRRSEVEAQRLRQDLSHVGRVSTIGELTASLAHELNQPLAAILSNAEAAQDVLDSSEVNLEEIREILADIVEDDKRAGEVIHRLGGLLKKGTLEFTTLDVNEMVGEVARLVSGDAVLRNVSIRLDLAPGLPPVWGDRVQLQQVVLNLVLNGLDAIRASASGERALVLWTAGDASTVRVGVRDSGTGIDEADLDHIFQAFYTTKPDGLGMGLAIARSIVEAHGGRLTVRNNPEGGATIAFALPAGRDAS